MSACVGSPVVGGVAEEGEVLGHDLACNEEDPAHDADGQGDAGPASRDTIMRVCSADGSRLPRMAMRGAPGPGVAPPGLRQRRHAVRGHRLRVRSRQQEDQIAAGSAESAHGVTAADLRRQADELERSLDYR
jgi:hypothetical protein